MAIQCEVCSKNDQKYKCPVCLIKYCTVACFKKHKEIGCAVKKSEPSEEESEKNVVTFPNISEIDCAVKKSESSGVESEKNIVVTNGIDKCESKETEANEKKEDFDTQDRVPLEKLQLLGRSENVLSLLHNPHLRAMMLQVDSDNSYETLQKAMQEPIFLEFAQACLHILEQSEELQTSNVCVL